MNKELINELEFLFSQPYYNPLTITVFLVFFVIGFYATFANSYSTVTLIRAQRYFASGKIPLILLLSLLLTILIPVLTIYLGFLLEIPYAISLGFVLLALTLVGAYLGTKSRLELLKELGFSYDNTNKYALILKFPTGTWENITTYFVNYSVNVIIFLIKLIIFFYIFGLLWPSIKNILIML
ncbi:MAG: hypothetical protein QW076_01210 [Candidatus Anstonellales archaeon]